MSLYYSRRDHTKQLLMIIYDNFNYNITKCSYNNKNTTVGDTGSQTRSIIYSIGHISIYPINNVNGDKQ